MERNKLESLIEQTVRGKRSVRSLVNRLLFEMGRGGRILVLDENVLGLDPFLSQMNYTVETVRRKLPDERIKPELSDRILITLNGTDFNDPEDMRKYNYGLIWVIRNPDNRVLSKQIERALMQANFGRNLLQVVKVP